MAVFHKGLTFIRRKPGELKGFKDLYGIWYVAAQLEDVSKLAVGELKSFASEHPAWSGARIHERLI